MTDVPKSQTLFAAVKDAILLSLTDNTITNAVVRVFVDKENDRRVKALVSALDKLKELDKALKAVDRPDNKTFTLVNGAKVVSETYSEKRIQEIEKAKKAYADLDKAISEAILEAKFDELSKVLQKVSSGSEKAGE